ncbi:hypothetical protein AAG906_035528 [Vitis piasezkii]
MSPPRRDKEQMDENEGKQKITSPKRLRSQTLKPEIAKKISEGVKIDIQYNDDGEGVVYHTDWRVVLVELKEKLWDCVKMQKTGSRKPIDRWVLWKLARLKKDEYDDVTRPVVGKIDELSKVVEEGKITCVGQKDILTLALGTSSILDGLEKNGKKPKQFFNTPKPTKTLEEEESEKKKKKNLIPHSKVSITNIRKQLLQHEEIRGKTHYSAHVENLSTQGTQKLFPLIQVYKCKLALETEDNIFKIIFVHPGMVSKAGLIALQIEKRARFIVDRLIDTKLADLIFLPYNLKFHWVLVVIDLKSQTIYYLDSLLQQPYQDIKYIVTMGFRIFVSQKKK